MSSSRTVAKLFNSKELPRLADWYNRHTLLIHWAIFLFCFIGKVVMMADLVLVCCEFSRIKSSARTIQRTVIPFLIAMTNVGILEALLVFLLEVPYTCTYRDLSMPFLTMVYQMARSFVSSIFLAIGMYTTVYFLLEMFGPSLWLNTVAPLFKTSLVQGFNIFYYSFDPFNIFEISEFDCFPKGLVFDKFQSKCRPKGVADWFKIPAFF